VVFDSGFEDWAPAWATVQPQIAKWTRACSYDRAGAAIVFLRRTCGEFDQLFLGKMAGAARHRCVVLQ
jgi:hypothetical protein